MTVFDTPLGPLHSLDLASASTCLDIISFDKHQIAEGLLAESVFDQIIERVPTYICDEASLLDVETFIAHGRNGLYAFVWWRTKSAGLGRYLIALEERFNVIGIRISSEKSGFDACKISNGQMMASGWMPLHELMPHEGFVQQQPFTVTEDVRDRKRQYSAFWGYLEQAYGARLKDHVALPRILVNWGIQRWCTHVWNIDRVLVLGKNIWVFETKHKYPATHNNRLFFGLNIGEVRLLDLLGQCGIRCMHTIIVKPYWNKKTSSMYLFTTLEAMRRALVIGLVIDPPCVKRISESDTGTSGSHTSVTGSSSLTYKRIPVGWFSPLAPLSDPGNVAFGLVQLMQGKLQSYCTDRMLMDLRMPGLGYRK